MSARTEISWTDSTFKPARSGPPPAAPRDGDKKQARQRINVLVRTGRIAHPNAHVAHSAEHWLKHRGYGEEFMGEDEHEANEEEAE